MILGFILIEKLGIIETHFPPVLSNSNPPTLSFLVVLYLKVMLGFASV